MGCGLPDRTRDHHQLAIIPLPRYAAFDAARALLDPLSPGTTTASTLGPYSFPLRCGPQLPLLGSRQPCSDRPSRPDDSRSTRGRLRCPSARSEDEQWRGIPTQLLHALPVGQLSIASVSLLVIRYLVMSFAPTPCFQNLFADLLFVATWLTVSYFAFSLLPEMVLKDHVFTLYLVSICYYQCVGKYEKFGKILVGFSTLFLTPEFICKVL